MAEAGHVLSPTAVAAEALRTGVLPRHAQRVAEVLREDDTMLLGGGTPTPDQNLVDDVGRAYGLQEEDTGVLRSAAEVLARRDRRRDELQPPGRPRA